MLDLDWKMNPPFQEGVVYKLFGGNAPKAEAGSTLQWVTSGFAFA